MQFEAETVQKFEDFYAKLLIVSAAEPSDLEEPLFIFKLAPGNSLCHIQELLSDQAFQFAKRLLLEYLPDSLLSLLHAFAQNQFSNLFEQRRRRVLESSLQFLRSLRVSEVRQLYNLLIITDRD